MSPREENILANGPYIKNLQEVNFGTIVNSLPYRNTSLVFSGQDDQTPTFSQPANQSNRPQDEQLARVLSVADEDANLRACGSIDYSSSKQVLQRRSQFDSFDVMPRPEAIEAVGKNNSDPYSSSTFANRAAYTKAQSVSLQRNTPTQAPSGSVNSQRKALPTSACDNANEVDFLEVCNGLMEDSRSSLQQISRVSDLDSFHKNKEFEELVVKSKRSATSSDTDTE